MAKGRKTPSRLELRRQAEQAEAAESPGEVKPKTRRAAKTEDAGAEPKPKKVAKKPAARSKKKKVELVRLRRMWGVFDNNNQQVATFPFAEKAAAEQKKNELNEKGKSVFFLQPVNEPIVEVKPEPTEAEVEAAAKKALKKAAAVKKKA